jgi:hypothetical protein
MDGTGLVEETGVKHMNGELADKRSHQAHHIAVSGQGLGWGRCESASGGWVLVQPRAPGIAAIAALLSPP